MTKRIFRSILVVALFVFLTSVILIMGVLYSYFSSQQKTQLKEQLDITAAGVEAQGVDFIKALDPDGYRLTLIAEDGDVLYDTHAGAKEMGNHLRREEVEEAIQTGHGESTRHSTTMMEQLLYESVRLEDGTILRISARQQTVFGLLLGMLQQLIVVLGISLLMALFLAYRMTKRVIEPLNDIDISGATDAEYQEIQPLIDRIKIQKNEIEIQKDQVRRKKNEFETVTKNMDEGLILIDLDNRIIFANQSAERIFLIDKDNDELLLSASSEFDKVAGIIKEAQKSGHVERNITIRSKAYTVHADPVGTDGKVHGTALLIMDMSWREKAEMVRREFTANVAHELKTPLQTISGSAELMYDGLVKDGDIRDFAKKIYSESKRLISLVDDITGLSQLDEEQYDHTVEELDLFTEAEHTIDQLQAAADRAETELTLTGKHLMIKGIRRLVDSIIFNLTDNAIKYNRPGGHVTVDVSQEGSKAVLTVKDDGIGIPEEDQERIFERFYRVDKSRSKEVGGTGLGLSIVKHAAMVHDAGIRIESEPGEGTKISVLFEEA